MTKEQTPLASLVLITYRDFSHVYEAIDSMLAQDWPETEIIVADDGSDGFPGDAIREYIEQHKRENVRRVLVYSNETNLGTVRNLNEAHAKCAGKYIVALAGDDVFCAADTVSRILRRMEETSCGVLAASRCMVDGQGTPVGYLPPRPLRKRGMKLTREQQYERMVAGQFWAMFSGGAMAVRRETFERLGGYDEKYRLWEDGPFFEKALREERVEPAFDIPEVYYRLDGVSNGGAHPLLKQDLETYNRTDRIARLDKVRPFFRALTLYNTGRRTAEVRRRLPAILAWKLGYRIRYTLAEKLDRILIRKEKKAGFTE